MNLRAGGHPVRGGTTLCTWARFLLLLVLGLSWLADSLSGAEPSASAQEPELPLTTIREFLERARDWGEERRVRLQGTVTASLSDRTYFMQEGDAGVYVFQKPSPALAVGDQVEVLGYPSLGSYQPTLQRSSTRTVGKRQPPAAVATTYAELMAGRHHMRLVTVQGRLAQERLRGGGQLVLTAGGGTHVFTAELEALTTPGALAGVRPGSWIELTGVCSIRANADRTRPVSFTVFLRSPEDVTVVRGPPWWTPGRTAALLGVAVVGLVLALLWGALLRRQVERRTADLRAQLETRAALEQRYRQLFESHPHPMWVHEREALGFLAVNEAALRHYGYSRAEFMTMTLRDLRPPDEVPAPEQTAAATDGLDEAGVCRHRRKDGQIIEVELTSHALEFDGRQAEVVLAHDVTERRRAVAALRRSEQYRRTIFEAEPECVKVVAADGTLLDMNPAGLAMLEVGSLAEARGATLAQFIRPDYRAAFARLQERVLAGASQTLEFEIEGRQGTRRWLETRAVPLPGANGADCAVLGITRDITARKRAEDELRRSQERLAAIFRASPIAILIARAADEQILDVNPAFERLTGFAAAEAIGHTTSELGLWVDEAARAAMIGRLKATRSVLDGEAELRAKDGRRFTALSSAEMIAYGGEPCMLSLTRDITERKLAEEALRRSEASLAAAQQELQRSERHFRALIERSSDAISVVGPGGVIRYASPAAGLITGYEVSELLGSPALAYVYPADLAGAQVALDALLANPGLRRHLVVRVRRKDGAVVWVDATAQSLLQDPAVGGIVVNYRDVTERIAAEQERSQLERQIQQTQKLESLGVLAGGIAHDFNNLLTAVMGNISLALMDAGAASPIREQLVEAERATERAADLARQMLAYSGKGRFVVRRVKLSEVVGEMISMLQVSISKKAVLRLVPGPDEPVVEADVTQLRQILLNLVTNASDAIGERSGVIAISTGAMECDRAYLTTTWLQDPLPEGRYAYLEVADTGSGIPRELLPKIFDPFFTTKFTGRGLGLAAVLGIVRGHKGALKVQSLEGQGTTFRVLLPAAAEPAEAPEAPGEVPMTWRGHGLVLLVDDEESVRGIGKRMLERLGFQVVLAAHGKEAVAAVQAHGGRLAGVVLDLTMPVMDGVETFRELRRLDADLPIILASGYSEQDAVQRFGSGGLAGFVGKPFTLADLQTVLQQLAPGPPSAPQVPAP